MNVGSHIGRVPPLAVAIAPRRPVRAGYRVSVNSSKRR